MPEKDWTEIEVAYAAWLRMARETLGSGAAVIRAVQQRLTPADLFTVHEDWASGYSSSDWRSARYKQWEKGRRSVPSQPAIRAALIATITESVQQIPVESEDFGGFGDLVDALEDERRRARATAGQNDDTQ
jgi:hypothetical protein